MDQICKQEGLEHSRHLSEERYYRKGKNDKRYRLTKTLKPVPTIFNPNIQTSQCSSSSHIISPVTVPRRSPRKRIYQDDQYQSFMNYDLINKLSDIEDSLSLAGFLFKNNDYVTFYKIEFSEKRAPEAPECIKIDKELHVKLFFKGCPVPLPQWFRQSTYYCLIRKSMLENFPVCLRTYADNHSTSVQSYKKTHLLSQYHKIQSVVKMHIYPVIQSLTSRFSVTVFIITAKDQQRHY